MADRVPEWPVIVCYGSGFTGGNLTFKDTVFVHASIQISATAAQAKMDRLGRRTSSRGELKAGRLLRWADPADLRRLPAARTAPAAADPRRPRLAGRPSLRVVHDEQSALTPWRIADIAHLLSDRHPGHTLDLVRVDSRRDARVQVADLVAGIAGGPPAACWPDSPMTRWSTWSDR